MTQEPLRGFRMTTARRPPGSGRGPTLRLVVIVVGLLVVLALAVFVHRSQSPGPRYPTPTPRPPATPSPRPTSPPEATATPSPTSTPPATPTAPSPTPTPTPWPTTPPRQRPAPRTTPAPAQCVEVRWSAGGRGSRFGAILIQADLVNRCGRDIGQLEVFLRATGWRDGGVVQSRTTHPLRDIPRNSRVPVAFDLPGSMSWYDEITLEVLDGAP